MSKHRNFKPCPKLERYQEQGCLLLKSMGFVKLIYIHCRVKHGRFDSSCMKMLKCTSKSRCSKSAVNKNQVCHTCKSIRQFIELVKSTLQNNARSTLQAIVKIIGSLFLALYCGITYLDHCIFVGY